MSQQHSDQNMPDAALGGAQDDAASSEFPKERQRLRLLPGASETAASFAFEREDHTLGNALRYMILKNPKVEFCGYSIPHPSEPFMNLRIQTWDNESVFDVLRKGLEDLANLCDVVEDKFTVARDEFNTLRSEQRRAESNDAR